MLYIHSCNGSIPGLIITDKPLQESKYTKLEMMTTSRFIYASMASGSTRDYTYPVSLTTEYLYEIKTLYKREIKTNGRTIDIDLNMRWLEEWIV